MKNTKICGVWLVKPLNNGSQFFEVGRVISNGGAVSGTVEAIEETQYGTVIATLRAPNGTLRRLRFHANVSATEEAADE